MKREFKSVPDAIKYFREKRGWRQSDLAERLNLRQSAVGNFEAGEYIPNLDTINKYAEALELSEEQKNLLLEIRDFMKMKKKGEVSGYFITSAGNELTVKFNLTNEKLIPLKVSRRLDMGSCRYRTSCFLVTIFTEKYAPKLNIGGFLVVDSTKKLIKEEFRSFLVVENDVAKIKRIRRESNGGTNFYICQNLDEGMQVITEDELSKIEVIGRIEDYIYRGDIQF